MKKVLGIGNALVDIMTRLDSDDFLDKFDLKKGSMQLVDAGFSARIQSETTHLEKELSSGGSAANTIHGLANMGVGTCFIGKTGNDSNGAFFSDDMKKSGIHPVLFRGQTDTGCAVALISKDSERTFATYLGAAVELTKDDLREDLFKGYHYFHIEGYLVQNRELIETAVKLAKKQKLVVSLDLASFNVVEQNLDFLKDIINKYVDIVFANEEEAKSFTGKEPEEAIIKIAEMSNIAIVKTGANGSLVKQNEDIIQIKAVKANCIDTTGAGDLYASGFLYGLTQNLPLEKCGAIGSVLAGKVIELIGAKLHSRAWEEAKKSIKSIR